MSQPQTGPGSPADTFDRNQRFHTYYPDPLAAFPVNWLSMRYLLDTYGSVIDGPEGHGHELILVDDQVAIHDHPSSGRPREIHFMVHDAEHGWQKVAELGPTGAKEENEDVATGYVDFLEEWAGQPVAHLDWKARIRRDNKLATSPIIDASDSLASMARKVLDSSERFVSGGADPQIVQAGVDLARVILQMAVVHDSYPAALDAPRVRHTTV
jgi:hypothetical protein